MDHKSDHTALPIVVDGKKFFVPMQRRIYMPSALFMSGASGLLGNIFITIAGTSLKDDLVSWGGLFCLSANITQMAEKVIRKIIPISERQVVQISAGQFAMSGICYFSAFAFHHEPTTLAFVAISSTAGSMASIFLPERNKGLLAPRTAGAWLFSLATANIWATAAKLWNPYVAAGALCSTISCYAYARSGRNLAALPIPQPSP